MAFALSSSTPLVGLALALVACHGHDQVEGSGAASASPSASAAVAGSAPSAPNPSPRPSPSSRAPTGETTAAGAAVGEVKLSTGARLTLPPNTSEKASPAARDHLPAEAKQARVFLLERDPKKLLMITEMDRQGKSCAAALDEQKAKIEAARADTDPLRTGVRKVSTFEELKAGEHRLLYTEAQQRKLVPPGSEPLPFTGIASATLCRDDTFVVLMYASTKPPPEGGTKKLLLDVAATWKKPG